MSTPNDQSSQHPMYPLSAIETDKGYKSTASAEGNAQARGWQSKLAQRLRIDRQKINDVMMGRRTSARVAAAIAAATGMPASQLWPGKYKRLEHAEKVGQPSRRPE